MGMQNCNRVLGVQSLKTKQGPVREPEGASQLCSTPIEGNIVQNTPGTTSKINSDFFPFFRIGLTEH